MSADFYRVFYRIDRQGLARLGSLARVGEDQAGVVARKAAAA